MPEPLLKLGVAPNKTQITHLPHLPRLTWDQCRRVFRRAGINDTALSQIAGITRRTLWLWSRPREQGGRDPQLHNLDNVSTLAYACLRALRGGALPVKGTNAAPLIVEAIQSKSIGLPPLDKCTAEQLLPETWLTN